MYGRNRYPTLSKGGEEKTAQTVGTGDVGKKGGGESEDASLGGSDKPRFRRQGRIESMSRGVGG